MGIDVEVVAVHQQRMTCAVQAFQHGGGVGVGTVGHLEHGKQLAAHGQIDDTALVDRVVLFKVGAGDLDAVILHQLAVADQHALLAHPADIALAVDGLAVLDLGQQTAVAAQHVQKYVAQRRLGVREH